MVTFIDMEKSKLFPPSDLMEILVALVFCSYFPKKYQRGSMDGTLKMGNFSKKKNHFLFDPKGPLD